MEHEICISCGGHGRKWGVEVGVAKGATSSNGNVIANCKLNKAKANQSVKRVLFKRDWLSDTLGIVEVEETRKRKRMRGEGRLQGTEFGEYRKKKRMVGDARLQGIEVREYAKRMRGQRGLQGM